MFGSSLMLRLDAILGDVEVEDALRVVAQILHAHRIIGLHHYLQGIARLRCLRIVDQNAFGAVRGGDIRAAPQVVVGTWISELASVLSRYCMRSLASGVYLLAGKRVTSSLNDSNDSRRAAGSRSAGSCLNSVAEHAVDVLVEADESLQVEHVIQMRAVRILFDETVQRGECRFRFAVFVVGVGDLHLRLLCVAAIRVARLQRSRTASRPSRSCGPASTPVPSHTARRQ